MWKGSFYVFIPACAYPVQKKVKWKGLVCVVLVVLKLVSYNELGEKKKICILR